MLQTLQKYLETHSAHDYDKQFHTLGLNLIKEGGLYLDLKNSEVVLLFGKEQFITRILNSPNNLKENVNNLDEILLKYDFCLKTGIILRNSNLFFLIRINL